MNTTETRVAEPVRKRIQEKVTPEEEAPGLSIGQIVQMLLKHKWFIIGCTLACALVALVYVKLARPVYEAEATVRIDQARVSSLGLGDLASPGGVSDLTTEIQILQSDQVAIGALNSLPDDIFQVFADADKKSMYIPANKEALTPDQEDLIGKLKNELTVKQLGDTQLVSITVRDGSPRVAATVANHVVSAYVRENFDSRHNSVSQVTDWLSTEMQDLQKRAKEAQKRLSDFEEQNGILATEAAPIGGGTTTTIDRLRELNQRLTSAQEDRIVKEAQMRAANVGNQDPAVLAAVFPNTRLQALLSNQVTLSAQYTQLSAKFGAGYTPLQELKKQLDEVSADITRNIQLVQSQVRKEYETAKTTEDMLRQEYEDQTGRAYALNRQQAELAVLQSQENASRELYNTLQVKLDQAGINAGLNGIGTVPIDMARLPYYPVAPKKTVILGFGTVLGLLIGIGSALVVEASADKVMGVDQLRSAVRYRSLGVIPRVRKNAASLVATDDPLSSGTEAYRRLRNLLLQSVEGQRLATLMVTSAQPEEGKSTVAANYAAVLAQTGARVLLVDAELRRPSLHTNYGVENGVGLAELLESTSALPHFLQPVASLPNLSLLTAGKQIALPAEALASNRFHTILQGWHSEFEYVVLKSAPLLSVSDSLPLASWVDGVLIVARQGVTRLKYLQSAQTLLRQTDANVVGVVISDATSASDLYGDENAYRKTAYAS